MFLISDIRNNNLITDKIDYWFEEISVFLSENYAGLFI